MPGIVHVAVDTEQTLEPACLRQNLVSIPLPPQLGFGARITPVASALGSFS